MISLVAILVLGFALRIVNLNQSLWLDEAVQTITAQDSLGAIFSELQGDFHPPLYHFLIWVWVHLFGSSEIIIRLPSVLLGTATIWVIYLLAKEISPKKYFSFFIFHFSFADLSALLLATAPFHIYYSQEARPYALVVFLASLSMYLFLKERWWGYLVATTLALYSSYFVGFVILAQVLVILLRRKFKMLLYCCLTILFFLPWLPMFFKQIQVGRQAVSLLPEWRRLVNVGFLKALPLTFIKFTLGRMTILDKTLYAGIVGMLVLVYGLVIIQGFFKNRKFPISNYPARIACGEALAGGQLLITLWLIIPILSAWLVSLFTPNYQPFRLLLVLPAFYLLLAFGINQFTARTVKIILSVLVILVNLVSLGAYYANPYSQREDWRGVVKFIESQDKPGVAILPSQTSDWPWRYYSLGQTEIIGVSPGARKISQQDFNNLAIKQSSNLPAGLSADKAGKAGQTIYYIRYLQPVFDPEEKIISWLQNLGYVKIREVSFNQIPIWEYEFLR